MKITGTRSTIKIEYNNAVYTFYGELCIDGFYAILSSAKRIDIDAQISESELKCLISAVDECVKNRKFKVFFE